MFHTCLQNLHGQRLTSSAISSDTMRYGTEFWRRSRRFLRRKAKKVPIWFLMLSQKQISAQPQTEPQTEAQPEAQARQLAVALVLRARVESLTQELAKAQAQ